MLRAQAQRQVLKILRSAGNGSDREFVGSWKALTLAEFPGGRHFPLAPRRRVGVQFLLFFCQRYGILTRLFVALDCETTANRQPLPRLSKVYCWEESPATFGANELSDSEQGEYYEVLQGENLTLIALRYGFADHKPIYDHPNNADFKRIRPNPDVLHPGDRVFIPEVRPREESCQTEKCHWFVLKWPKKVLRITLEDSDGKAITDAPYEFTVDPPPPDWSSRVTLKGRLAASNRTLRGKTDSSGSLEEPVAVNAARARLKIGSLVWELAIGHLDPHKQTPDDRITGITGIQARLQNLGFYSGQVDGILGPRTTGAIRAFQRKYQPQMDPPDGICGQGTETLSILKEKHRS